MFFSQIVLAKRGTLGKIWLAGHWDKKLAKNVVFKTNIPKSVKTILNPHSPMALRMTSHLLLGVVRIFSKKAKYLLSDCTEAVVKLKGLSKTVSKIDLPTEQDPQALLTSGPRQSDKPQVYQEVDRFLRNIDIRDLVVDPLYDPNKLEPVEKPNYSDFFGVTDEAVLGETGGLLQTPVNQNNLMFDPTTTITPASDRRFRSNELRDFEQSAIATPDSTIIGQGRTPKTPESVKSNIDILISDTMNPLFNFNLSDTPLRPKTPQHGMDDGVINDQTMLDFGEGMFDNVPKTPVQPGEEEEQVTVGLQYEDHGWTGPEGGVEEEEQPIQYDEQGQPITPAKSITTITTEYTTTPAQTPIQQPVIQEEKTEEEIQRLQQQLLLEKQREAAEKNKAPKKTRRSRVLGSTLSTKDINRFKNTKSLTLERTLLPSDINIVISKSKEIPAKQQMLTSIRKNISNTFHRMYNQVIENKYPKLINRTESSYISYLRSRVMYNRMLNNSELRDTMEADGVSIDDLGIPKFVGADGVSETIEEEYERKVEEALLKSINNRIISESGNLIAPSERKKIKLSQLTSEEKELVERMTTEFDARKDNKQPLFYKPDISEMLREEEQYHEIRSAESPTSSEISKRRQQEEEEERRRVEGDMGFEFGRREEEEFGVGIGMEHDIGEALRYPEDIEVPQEPWESAQKHVREEEKKILSQKTANMHAILDKNFADGKKVINFLDDIVKPQQQINPNSTRFVAACYFYELLVLKTKVLIDLEQKHEESDETYPDIKITKTSQFGNIKDYKIVNDLS